MTLQLRDAGQLVAAAGGLAQLAGELPGDSRRRPRDRRARAPARRDVARRAGRDARRCAARSGPRARAASARARVARRAARDRCVDGRGRALARLRGETAPRAATHAPRRTPQSGRAVEPRPAPRCRCAMPPTRSRAAGKLDDALATLETANHVAPATRTCCASSSSSRPSSAITKPRRSTSPCSPSCTTGCAQGRRAARARRHVLRPARRSAAGARRRCAMPPMHSERRPSRRHAAHARERGGVEPRVGHRRRCARRDRARAPQRDDDVRGARERARARRPRSPMRSPASSRRSRAAGSRTAACCCARCAPRPAARARSRTRSIGVDRHAPTRWQRAARTRPATLRAESARPTTAMTRMTATTTMPNERAHQDLARHRRRARAVAAARADQGGVERRGPATTRSRRPTTTTKAFSLGLAIPASRRGRCRAS